ncbi:PQQ-binding-like beta-propeller repeat protein [Phragmitibacter flavus]|uniref:outer membrane protein assembly factor BamB family protein n=1 Tax=Phragmitibacter flavus TaxID=2576071 RepID=UPI001F0F7519|nr:PQQ-binding-like beta-propeller repeat protein [Phragmitibacter flavus]
MSKFRFHRLWMPLLLVLAAVGAIFAVGVLRPEMDRNLNRWLTTAIWLLCGLLNVFWFLLFSRVSGKLRLGIAVALVVLGVAASQMVRVDGVVDGSGLPKLAWSWSGKGTPDLALPAPASVGVAVAGEGEGDPSVALDGTVDGSADVPQFFGALRDGVVRGVEMELVSDWKAAAPKEMWRQPIGAGWSAFAVVGGRAFTQEQRGAEELVTCYELLTGRLLWSHSDAAHFTQWQGGEGPRATPTVVDGRVYSYGATGILNCLEMRTGKLVWSRKVLEEVGSENLEWGTSSSPLVFDDKVVVTGGSTSGAVLLAFARDSGEPVWKAGSDEASYASPLLATLAGRRVILSNNARSLTFHDPATGVLVAEHEWGDARWPKASQPVVMPGDRLFLSGGYGMGCQMVQVTAAGEEGKLAVAELWRGLKLKTQFNSASFGGEFLFGLDDGRMACIDPANGDRLWKEGRFGSGQSLMVNDGLVIIQSEPGPVYLASVKREGFEELGKLEALSSKTWNHPTLAGRYLLVRNDREVVCYELPVK